ncbi:collagenase [unidentified bacterial endosymbiont]|uniref:collagenase n=1 Tax=unidentified bacterial endosymbiont TaxID=2355 RepID=UPI00209C7930|nr:collagenase [unidentified bacterial endosymbiont]
MATFNRTNQRLNNPNPAVASIHYRTKENYFNNNGRGYQTPELITLPSHNIKVELYCNRLKPNKLTTIQQAIQAVAAEFSNAVNLPLSPSAPQETFRIYLFDRKEDYQYFGGEEQFKWGLGSEGGKAHYRGRPEVHSELYLYQQGDTLNLKHELTHALTFYVTKGHSASIPTWLMEGIAEYFEHQKGVVHVSQQESQALTTEAINNLAYSDDPKENNLLYRMGHAMVSYLQDQHPTLLGQYLSFRNNAQSEQADSLLQAILSDLSSRFF